MLRFHQTHQAILGIAALGSGRAKSGVMLAQLRINNTGPFQVLLGTAADVTFISPAIAAQVGINTAQQKPIQMLGFVGWKTQRSPSSTASSHHRQEKLEAVITDSSVLKMLGVDGVLGQNFLRRYRQDWHFPQREGALGFLLLEAVE
jgi:hypothetical protein